MPHLKTWCFPGGDRRGLFASLKELQISKCSQLSKIPFCFPCLTTLGISECDELIEIEMSRGLEKGSVSTTYGHSLLSIEITKCPKLEEIPKSFVNLVDVDCGGGCNKLVSVPRLQHAHNLSLSYVSESMSLKAAIQDSTYLKELSIESDCNNLTVELLSMDLNRLTSLNHLHLMIPSDDYERMGWENDNQSLKITSCHALTTISGEFLSSCSNSLRELTIENCDNLVCLPRSLSTIQSLRILSLLECPKLVILKDCGLPTALTHLTIKNCDEMKAVSNLRLTKLTSL
uniref:Uncharacterized protein n=1 Tax=Kalanchoe fedtschenkoi TaxID=63787 RepID=A0A7N0RFH4_KALFE